MRGVVGMTGSAGTAGPTGGTAGSDIEAVLDGAGAFFFFRIIEGGRKTVEGVCRFRKSSRRSLSQIS